MTDDVSHHSPVSPDRRLLWLVSIIFYEHDLHSSLRGNDMRKVVKHSMFVTNIQSWKLLLIWAIGNSFAWVEQGLPLSPWRTYAGRERELYHSLHRRRGTPFTTCQLFLRPTNIEKSAVSWRVPSKAYDSLRTTDLPWNIDLEPHKLNNVNVQGSLERPSTLPS
jgi:hypothetical protein